MIYFWLILLLIVNAFWLGLVFFSLPGSWLMIITTILFALWQKNIFSVYTIIAAIILALVGEILEFLAGAGGAKAAGGGKKAMAAAVVGAIIGAIIGTIIIPIPIFGTLIGSALGAAIAALIVERKAGKEMKQSLKIATGAGLGRFAGLGAKIIAGVIIWLIFTAAAFIN
ncbi:MAG: DUF456 family protein [Phycisphaerae bacterium]|nr:DUF456 family protein [Phycisphaerae bacterium]